MKRLTFLALALILLAACAACTLSFRTDYPVISNVRSATLTEGEIPIVLPAVPATASPKVTQSLPSCHSEEHSDEESFRSFVSLTLAQDDNGDTLLSRTSSQMRLGAPGNMDSLYYNEKVYETAKQQAEAYSVNGTVTAGIIPHHGTASRMIASFFEMLTESYDTVIIIGPNHYKEGSAVVYSDCGWRTEKGDIECDSEFVQKLKNDLAIDADAANEAVQNDHSIGWHLPYIADYLPDTRLAAIMLQQEVSETALKALTQLIADYAAEKNVLLIGSVDFSHYLMPDEARQMDELTKSVIASADYGRLMRMGSDNVDSPQTVYVVMKTLELMGAELQLLDRSISYEQAGGTEHDVDPQEGTTTYMVYAGIK